MWGLTEFVIQVSFVETPGLQRCRASTATARRRDLKVRHAELVYSSPTDLVAAKHRQETD
jgi:hypothetical protein